MAASLLEFFLKVVRLFIISILISGAKSKKCSIVAQAAQGTRFSLFCTCLFSGDPNGPNPSAVPGIRQYLQGLGACCACGACGACGALTRRKHEGTYPENDGERESSDKQVHASAGWWSCPV